MKRILILGAAVAALAGGTSAARAADPVPFPGTSANPVFIAAQTVTTDGAMTNYFAPGNTVVFRSYAVIKKSKRLVLAKDVKYFYVTIPGQSNVKLAYDPKAAGATTRMPWVGTWKIPADYKAGNVLFGVHIKLKGRQTGYFVQMPVATAMLSVSATPPAVFAPAPKGDSGETGEAGKIDLSLYVDSVNGTRPVGAAPRQVGCSQTNVYKHGEQAVFRIWGMDLTDGTVLSSDNVDSATVSIAGVPDITLNWGAHGAKGAQVYFWSAPWIVPADFPLGETVAHINFKTVTGETVTYDYALNIIP